MLMLVLEWQYRHHITVCVLVSACGLAHVVCPGHSVDDVIIISWGDLPVMNSL